MSLRRSSYVAPKSPKGGLKNAKRPISVKIGLRMKKVCYKVSLCEKCQRQSCKAFIGLLSSSSGLLLLAKTITHPAARSLR